MCGFIRRVTDSDAVRDLLDQIGLGHLALQGGDFRPQAWLQGLIIDSGREPIAVDALWWYLLELGEGGRLQPNASVSSFNARRLDSRLWRAPIARRRGIVVADAIGESEPVPGSKVKRQYLMESPGALILGALWNVYPTGPTYSTAVITRDPHERFSRYHSKSFPLFLPQDPEFIKLWLDPAVETHPAIDAILAQPRLFYDLEVTQVKTYKSSTAQGDTELLEAD